MNSVEGGTGELEREEELVGEAEEEEGVTIRSRSEAQISTGLPRLPNSVTLLPLICLSITSTNFPLSIFLNPTSVLVGATHIENLRRSEVKEG